MDGFDTFCHGVNTLNFETWEAAPGDGMAMAHRAQVVISNIEFVQFHPTALAHEGLPITPTKTRENAFLITEAVRGGGGLLYNLGIERFMPLYDERAELAPRDVVACTGLHGANRLASNSLLEALVFTRRSVQPSIDHMKSSKIDRSVSDWWGQPVVPMSLGRDVLGKIVRITRQEIPNSVH
ncbi:hypothetical protein LOK49_LG01G02359 [Camellia lanceoleosa]|uniref:Uncharacterized protein n=1 Tax=Camellia lanceoleosa TaxID=1840588 RepID=A0ACC0IVG2_9ERIC|nr:hypothetical protein LOK49_LG01G02359 [Camellia lanceoleosa]